MTITAEFQNTTLPTPPSQLEDRRCDNEPTSAKDVGDKSPIDHVPCRFTFRPCTGRGYGAC